MNDMHTDKLPSVESLPAGNMWNSALSTYADCFEEWAAAGAAWQSEVSQFAERRLKDNLSTWLTLLSARDAASVWQAQGAVERSCPPKTIPGKPSGWPSWSPA